MVKCKLDGCPDGKNICCGICPDNADCPQACFEKPKECGNSVFEDSNTTSEMVAFEGKAGKLMLAIADISRQKEQLEAKDAEMRKQLVKIMDDFGIQKFENDIVSITYVGPTSRTTVDSKKLQAKFPDAYNACLKISTVKGSVRIAVKGAKK